MSGTNSIKQLIKYFLGHIRCRLNRIYPQKHVYIGKAVKILKNPGGTIELSPEVIIRPYVDLWATGGHITVGAGTEIGERCRISISNELRIGNAVLFSPNVYVTDCDHEYRSIGVPVIHQGVVKNENRVEIGDGSYIGINSVIVGNVKIGKYCVVGANSVVTKDVPDYCVVVGSPAHVIKRYNPTLRVWERLA